MLAVEIRYGGTTIAPMPSHKVISQAVSQSPEGKSAAQSPEALGGDTKWFFLSFIFLPPESPSLD